MPASAFDISFDGDAYLAAYAQFNAAAGKLPASSALPATSSSSAVIAGYISRYQQICTLFKRYDALLTGDRTLMLDIYNQTETHEKNLVDKFESFVPPTKIS